MGAGFTFEEQVYMFKRLRDDEVMTEDEYETLVKRLNDSDIYGWKPIP